MRDDPAVIALVARAADGDQDAWNELVERYAPMVWSICTRFQLSRSDIEDVGQTVWLRLVEQLGNLREPAALPGWLATTTQRECLRVLRAHGKHDQRGELPDEVAPPTDSAMVEQEVLTAERNAALRSAFAMLPLRCRQLLSMLISEPPHSYQEISRVLEIPIGSIGPQRARCLQRLRSSDSLADFINGGSADNHFRR